MEDADLLKMSKQGENHDDGSTGLVVETARPKLKKPPMYKVVMLNDDYTPMEFVIMILEKLFRLNHEQSVQVMLSVHQKGKGICGVYPHEIAQTKVAQVLELAHQNEHPLQCTMESV